MMFNSIHDLVVCKSEHDFTPLHVFMARTCTQQPCTGITEVINSLDGTTLEMRAEVGLLSHNIRIVGMEYDGDAMATGGFGARVVVGRAANTIDPVTGDPLLVADRVTYNGTFQAAMVFLSVFFLFVRKRNGDIYIHVTISQC